MFKTHLLFLQLVKLKKENDAYSKQVQTLERQLKLLSTSGSASSPGVDKDKKRMEKQIKVSLKYLGPIVCILDVSFLSSSIQISRVNILLAT